jgi:hypothetical protein
MIEKDVELTKGTIIRQDEEGGLRYQIIGRILDATGWETAHEVVGGKVAYKQLEAGQYRAGQLWEREDEDLRENFSIEEQPQV